MSHWNDVVKKALDEDMSKKQEGQKNGVAGIYIADMYKSVITLELTELDLIYALCDSMMQGNNSVIDYTYFVNHQEKLKKLIKYMCAVVNCGEIDSILITDWYYKYITSGIMLYENNMNYWFEHDCLKAMQCEISKIDLVNVKKDKSCLEEIVKTVILSVLQKQIEQCCEQLGLNASLLLLYIRFYCIEKEPDGANINWLRHLESLYNTVGSLFKFESKTLKQFIIWMGLPLNVEEVVGSNESTTAEGIVEVETELDFIDFVNDEPDLVEYEMPSDYDAGAVNSNSDNIISTEDSETEDEDITIDVDNILREPADIVESQWEFNN